jgi:hypothetical protein
VWLPKYHKKSCDIAKMASAQCYFCNVLGGILATEFQHNAMVAIYKAHLTVDTESSPEL